MNERFDVDGQAIGIKSSKISDATSMKRRAYFSALVLMSSLIADITPTAAEELPHITAAEAPLFSGRWDFVPTIAPDVVPVDIVALPSGDVWIATGGSILRRQAGQSAFFVGHWADGRDAPPPSIIAYDMIALDHDRVLVSTIWREIFIAGPEGLVDVNLRDISGAYTFANLPDGRLALAESDIRMDDTVADSIAAMTGRDVFFAGTAEALAVVEDQLFAIMDGTLTPVDIATGERGTRLEFADIGVGISAARSTGDGRLLVATTPHYNGEGCYIVDPHGHRATVKVYDGACYDFVEVAPDDFWASTSEGIFRFDGAEWLRYFSNAPNGLGGQAMFATTETGSLWVASTIGLWRHYLHTRQIHSPASGQIVDLHRDGQGHLFLADETRAVYLRDGESWRRLLPERQNGTYSRLPRMADGPGGAVIILHPDGLFRFDGTDPVRLTDGPTNTNTVAPTTLAVCPDGTVFVGFAWSTDVERLDGQRWIRDYYLAPNVGGSAIADLDCDANGFLWALGPKTVAVRTPEGHWHESDSFELRSNAKGNFFGALLPHSLDQAVTAWGPWGSSVEVSLSGETLVARAVPLGPEAPYIFYDAERYGENSAVLTDKGVHLWKGERLVRIALVEERLQRVATAMAGAVADDGAFGFEMVIGSGGELFVVAPVLHRPSLDLKGPPSVDVRVPFATLEFDLDERAYSPEEGSLQVDILDPLPAGFEKTIRPDGVVSLTGLPPDRSVSFSARFTDAAGQVSGPVSGTLLYDRPLEQDPRTWIAAFVILLLALILLARSPALVDLLVRRFGRRQWRVLLGPIDRKVTLTRDEAGHLRGEMTADGATLKLSTRSQMPIPLSELIDATKRVGILTAATATPTGRKAFSNALDKLACDLTATLPEALAFELQSLSGKSLMLDLGRDLAALPWDCLNGHKGSRIIAANQLSRVVRSDRVAVHAGLTGRLRAAVFTADAGDAPEAAIWADERDFVTRAFRKAGVLSVDHISGVNSDLQLGDWLDGVDIVHFTGHASLGGEGTAHFWYAADRSFGPSDIRRCLESIKNPPALVFINACGSLEQNVDLGGAALAGLATPFLEVGTTVIGTQWPVQTIFANELAVAFYSHALPPANALLWRWIRRRPLEGQSFSDALSEARRLLMRRRPETDPTWSAYTIYGDPTARLSLS